MHIVRIHTRWIEISHRKPSRWRRQQRQWQRSANKRRQDSLFLNIELNLVIIHNKKREKKSQPNNNSGRDSSSFQRTHTFLQFHFSHVAEESVRKYNKKICERIINCWALSFFSAATAAAKWCQQWDGMPVGECSIQPASVCRFVYVRCAEIYAGFKLINATRDRINCIGLKCLNEWWWDKVFRSFALFSRFFFHSYFAGWTIIIEWCLQQRV